MPWYGRGQQWGPTGTVWGRGRGSEGMHNYLDQWGPLSGQCQQDANNMMLLGRTGTRQ